MHWRSGSLPGRARLAWAAAGVGPPGSCLRTSCKCYRFLPINADLIKWSPDAGPEHCVPAFSVSLQNITLTGLLPHPWEGDTAKYLGRLHLRGLSDVPLRLPLCGQRQPEHSLWGALGCSVLPQPASRFLGERCALGPVSASRQRPAEPTPFPPPPKARHPLPGGFGALRPMGRTSLHSKQGEGALCTREQLSPSSSDTLAPGGLSRLG